MFFICVSRLKSERDHFYLQQEVKECQLPPLRVLDPNTGRRFQVSTSSTVGLQQLLVLQPAERHRVLVVVLVGQVLNVWIPPHGRSGGAADVSVGQNLTFKGAQHHGETPVEAQHPVQVECKHFKPVLGAFDQRAASLLAALAVSVALLAGGSVMGWRALQWWLHKKRNRAFNHILVPPLTATRVLSQTQNLLESKAAWDPV